MLLRSFQPDDAPELFNAVNNSRQHLRSWFDWVDQTNKVEHSLHFIQKSLNELQYQESLALGIFYKGHIIGSIGVHHWDHITKRAELGYWIAKEHEGRGILNRCLVRFIDFLFNKVGLNKIEIRFIPSNTRSANTAMRLGFKTEGLIRQCSLRNGRLEDIVITGLLKSEWSIKV
jgi:ribosomal-protein-serine acetyltransferase